MKYSGIDVIEVEVTPNVSHTVRVVERLGTDKPEAKKVRRSRSRADKSGGEGAAVAEGARRKTGGGDIVSKMFWQAAACAMLFTAMFCINLFGGGWGAKVTDTVKSVIGYNVEVLGTPNSDIGKIKFAGLFDKKYSAPSELHVNPAVKDKEFLVLTDRVVYLTNVEEMVYAVGGGTVKDIIRDEHDLVSLRIVGKDYDIVYKKLEFCGVKDGDVVKTGDMIGSFSHNGLQVLFVLPDGAVVTGLDSIIRWEE